MGALLRQLYEKASALVHIEYTRISLHQANIPSQDCILYKGLSYSMYIKGGRGFDGPVLVLCEIGARSQKQ